MGALHHRAIFLPPIHPATPARLPVSQAGTGSIPASSLSLTASAVPPTPRSPRLCHPFAPQLKAAFLPRLPNARDRPPASGWCGGCSEREDKTRTRPCERGSERRPRRTEGIQNCAHFSFHAMRTAATDALGVGGRQTVNCVSALIQYASEARAYGVFQPSVEGCD